MEYSYQACNKDKKNQLKRGDKMPLDENTLAADSFRARDSDLQSAHKYKVERVYTEKRTFDEVLARICLVYMDKQRNLGE